MVVDNLALGTVMVPLTITESTDRKFIFDRIVMHNVLSVGWSKFGSRSKLLAYLCLKRFLFFRCQRNNNNNNYPILLITLCCWLLELMESESVKSNSLKIRYFEIQCVRIYHLSTLQWNKCVFVRFFFPFIWYLFATHEFPGRQIQTFFDCCRFKKSSGKLSSEKNVVMR